MDRVEALAESIVALGPKERQRLWDLLENRGVLSPTSAGTMTRETQPARVAKGSAQAKGPDYVLIFDGGSKGNPGWGYGSYAISRTQDGAQRLERLALGDGFTSNEAEYDTLIAALEDLLLRIKEAGRQPQEFSLEVRGDSALVINQVQGKWQARETRMRDRRDRCLRLLRRFGSVTLVLQPRAESVRVLGH
jgi:ribonuclease HI